MSEWHRFQDTDAGDDECGRCAVVVAPEAHLTFSLPCPVGDCPSPSNPDRGCVFAPGRLGCAMCVYCGRSGHRAGDPIDPADDDTLDALALTYLEPEAAT